jgi:hypothetical protein
MLFESESEIRRFQILGQLPGPGPYLRAGDERPAWWRFEDYQLDLPDGALCIDSKGGDVLAIAVPGPNLELVLKGEARTTDEALGSRWLSQIDLNMSGNTLVIQNPELFSGKNVMANVMLKVPRQRKLIFDGNYSPVSAIGFDAPVEIRTTHARAMVLNTTKDVVVRAPSIHFAGDSGRVELIAQDEPEGCYIAVKVNTPKFEGTLRAVANGSMRIFLPNGFQSGFRIDVDRPDDFIFPDGYPVQRQSLDDTRAAFFSGAAAEQNLHFTAFKGQVTLEIYE